MNQRDEYLRLIDLSPHFIDRVKEFDYARAAALLGMAEEEVRAEHDLAMDEYLASLGLTRAEVAARIALAKANFKG